MQQTEWNDKDKTYPTLRGYNLSIIRKIIKHKFINKNPRIFSDVTSVG